MMSICEVYIIYILLLLFHRFPHSKGDAWENLFPRPTFTQEIKLVDALVKYNPKKRWTASEVNFLFYISKRFI